MKTISTLQNELSVKRFIFFFHTIVYCPRSSNGVSSARDFFFSLILTSCIPELFFPFSFCMRVSNLFSEICRASLRAKHYSRSVIFLFFEITNKYILFFFLGARMMYLLDASKQEDAIKLSTTLDANISGVNLAVR